MPRPTFTVLATMPATEYKRIDTLVNGNPSLCKIASLLQDVKFIVKDSLFVSAPDDNNIIIRNAAGSVLAKIFAV